MNTTLMDTSKIKKTNRLERIGKICTVIMVVMSAVGGIADLAQVKFPLATGLGMPWFVGIILGTAKVLAVAAFLTRRFPTLREWAYAGLTFELLGAAACHVLSGAPVYYAVPALFDLSFVFISYYLWHRANVQISSFKADVNIKTPPALS